MKYLLGISAIIIALSVGYYFVIFLPQKDYKQQQDYQQQQVTQDYMKQKECLALGEKRYNQDKVDEAGLWTLESPNYHYNKTLNTCLYGIQKNSGFDKNWKCAGYTIEVTDILSNTVILTFTQNGPTCQTTMSRDAFDKRYIQLFSE